MEKQPLPDEYREFLETLNKHRVRYMVVEGWARAFHGSPRMTRDIDIWVAIDHKNARRVREAWTEFGGPGLPGESFFRKGKNVYWMGRDPIRIEIVSGIDGVEFLDCYRRRNSIEWDGVDISFLGYEDFVASKRASGRLRDLADLEDLGEDID